MANKRGSITLLLMLLLLASSVFLGAAYINNHRNKDNVLSSISPSQAQLNFQPPTLTIPPAGSSQLMVNVSSEKVEFVHAEINFDNTKIKLSQEISTSGSPFTRIVKVTSATEANTTGKITIALALDPAYLISPPTGSVKVANLYWSPNTLSTNVPTSVSLNIPAIKVVNSNAELFTVNVTNLALTVNPVVTPTPTPSTTPAPTQTPTPSPKPVSTDTTAPIKYL